MSQNITTSKFEGGKSFCVSSRCGACGEQFVAPLLAMVFSESATEEYYACPKCLSKVAGLRKEPEVAEINNVKDNFLECATAEVPVKQKVEGPGGCTHHLGYLKNRLKNTPIPEECLTCIKMIDCMY